MRLLATASLVFLAATAAADPRTYTGVTDQLYSVGFGSLAVDCSDAPLGLNPGFVCFPSGHIQPDAGLTASVIIRDELMGAVSGYYCQDLNGDSICGGGGEFDERFCAALTLFHVDAGTPEVNWNPSFAVRVYVDGPLAGSPLLSPCGSQASVGVIGTVEHDP